MNESQYRESAVLLLETLETPIKGFSTVDVFSRKNAIRLIEAFIEETLKQSDAALRKRVEELEVAKAEQEKNTLRYVVKEDPSGEVGMVWVAMDQESIDYQLNEDTKRISFDAEDFVGAQMTVIFSDGREANASG